MTLPRGSRKGGWAMLLACLGALSCEQDAEPPHSHPAAVLPEACHSIIHWPKRPDAAAMALLRSLREKSVDRVGVPEIFFGGPGVLAIYTDPKKGWSSRLAFVDLAVGSKPDLTSIRASSGMSQDFVLELVGRRLWLLPRALEGFPASKAARLGQQSWFMRSVEGLERPVTPAPAARESAAGDPAFRDPGVELDLHLDLSRLLDLARSAADKEGRQSLDLLVGIDSFLSLGMRVVPHLDKGKGKIDLFFRLASTPDGIAAALDVDATEELLARLIHELPGDAGYLILNFRLATLTDAIKAKILGVGETNPMGMAASMSKSAKVLLRGDLPRAFGNQWALVDPQGKLGHGGDFQNSGAYMLASLDYSKKLGDQMLILAQFGSFLGGKITGKRVGDGLLFESSLFGWDLAIVLGKDFAALASQSSKSLLLDLLARESDMSLTSLSRPQGLPALPENVKLRGRGSWSLDFLQAFLPGQPGETDPIRDFLEALIAKDRRFRFQSLRVEDGLLLQGRW